MNRKMVPHHFRIHRPSLRCLLLTLVTLTLGFEANLIHADTITESTIAKYENESLYRTQVINTELNLPSNSIYPKAKSFEELISETSFFIDNSMLIPYFDIIGKLLVTLPPGFGKSINLNMLRRFFEIELNKTTTDKLELKKTNSYRIFLKGEFVHDGRLIKLPQKLLVGEHPVVKKISSKPVIYLTFQSPPIFGSKAQIDEFVRNRIRASLVEHGYISTSELSICKQYRNTYEDILANLEACSALDTMTNILPEFAVLLEHVFNKKVLLLIDDYDAVINSVSFLSINFNREEVDKIIRSFGSLYNALNKIEHIFITGTIHLTDIKIGKINVNTLAEGGNATRYYGVNQNNVEEILNKRGILNRSAEIEEHYKGYDFGAKKELIKYNPYTICQFALNPDTVKSARIETGNIDTLINYLIRYRNFHCKLYKLLLGGVIDVQTGQMASFKFAEISDLSEAIVTASNLEVADWYKTTNNHANLAFRLMFANGYLTKSRNDEFSDETQKTVTSSVRITNGDISKTLWFKYVESLVPDKTAKTLPDKAILFEMASRKFNKLLINVLQTNCTDDDLAKFTAYFKDLIDLYPTFWLKFVPIVFDKKKIIESLLETQIASKIYSSGIVKNDTDVRFNWDYADKPDIVLVSRANKKIILFEFEIHTSEAGNLSTIAVQLEEHATSYLKNPDYSFVQEVQTVAIVVTNELLQDVESKIEFKKRSK